MQANTSSTNITAPPSKHVAVISKYNKLNDLCQKFGALYRRCELRNQKDAKEVCEDELKALFDCQKVLEEYHKQAYVFIAATAIIYLFTFVEHFTKQQKHYLYLSLFQLFQWWNVYAVKPNSCIFK